MSYKDGYEFYVEKPDPDGETYDDGSRDLLGAGGWPARYPDDPTKADVHIGTLDLSLSEPELAWLIEDGGPKLLAFLRAQLGEHYSRCSACGFTDDPRRTTCPACGGQMQEVGGA